MRDVARPLGSAISLRGLSPAARLSGVVARRCMLEKRMGRLGGRRSRRRSGRRSASRMRFAAALRSGSRLAWG